MLKLSRGFSGNQHQSATVCFLDSLASLPFSESLHAKTGLVPSYQHSQIICCHKRVQKQNVLLTFNISVLGLLIHSETVINVTEMQIRVRTLPGGCEGAMKGPSLPPTWHSRMHLPLQGNTLCLFSSYWVPSLISSSKISLPPPPPRYICFPVHHRIC